MHPLVGIQALKLSGGSHGDTLECLRFLPGHRLVSKSSDGVMLAWDMAARCKLASWKVSQHDSARISVSQHAHEPCCIACCPGSPKMMKLG